MGSEKPSLREKLARMLPSGCQAGADLAYPPASIAVGVSRVHGVVPPSAMRFEAPRSSRRNDALPDDLGVARRRRPDHVDGVSNGLPVRGILAGTVPTRRAARTVRVSVVAYVVDLLAGFERADELLEPVAMRGPAVFRAVALLAAREVAVVVRVAIRRPRPALIRPALIHLGEVLNDWRLAAQVRSARQGVTVLLQLFVMSVAQSLGFSRAVTFAARPHHGPVPGLKCVPVDHEPPVVSDTHSPEVHGPLAMQAIGHSPSLARIRRITGHLDAREEVN